MPRKESTQGKITRVRPPRVHITYEVETGGAIELKELPFVAGILSDLSGKPEEALPRLRDRKFVDIDRDNFNNVMRGMKPRLAYKVDNKLSDDDTKLGVELRFNNLEDFEPEQVANQVEPLRKLLEIRKQLSGLLSKTDGNDRLSDELQKILNNTELLEQVGKEANIKSEDDGSKEPK